ncbi:MAG: transglutaminase domain-containing protein [Armatimonadetes bacterium]|nr:transglutaminase domain-containing protein [Armatimonadota bacterium]
MIGRRWRLALVGPALVFSACTGPALGARETWYGVYLMSQKAGYLTTRTVLASVKGLKRYTTEAKMEMRVAMLGSAVEVSALTRTVTGPGGQPLSLFFESRSGGHVSTVRASFTKDAVAYRADAGGSVKEGTLRLKAGERFVTDPASGEVGFAPKAGLTVAGMMFEPQSLRLIHVATTVGSVEAVQVGPYARRAYRLESKTDILNSTLWVGAAGELLKMTSVMGMEVRRESREQAQARPDGMPDLVARVSVKSQPALTEPRKVKEAVYRMSGFSAPLALPDSPVQTSAFTRTGKGTYRGEFTVRAADPAHLPDIPIASIEAARFRPYLASSLYVQPQHPRIAALAREIAGQETSALKAAQKLSDWTHRALRADASIGAFRSAVDVLESGRGVCRDYAVLFASLARAAGIPTKICLGLVAANGAFMYHAWAECWVGEWAAFEPTFGLPFDAAHIKLAEGDLSNIFDITRDFGKFKIRAVRFR